LQVACTYWYVTSKAFVSYRIVTDDPNVVSIVDADNHRARVAERLAWQWTRIEFQPRKAQQFGETIEIVVRKQIDPDHPFGCPGQPARCPVDRPAGSGLFAFVAECTI